MQNLWQRRREGFPVPYVDPWNDAFMVRILKMQQTQMLRQPDMVPETTMDFTLLEVTKGRTALDFLYDTVQPDGPLDPALYGYNMPLSQYDTVSHEPELDQLQNMGPIKSVDMKRSWTCSRA
jgi:hypothetical protein